MSVCLEVRSAVVRLRRTSLSVFKQRGKLSQGIFIICYLLFVLFTNLKQCLNYSFRQGPIIYCQWENLIFGGYFFFFLSFFTVCVFVYVSNCISSHSFFSTFCFSSPSFTNFFSPFSLLSLFFLSFFLSFFLDQVKHRKYESMIKAGKLKRFTISFVYFAKMKV